MDINTLPFLVFDSEVFSHDWIIVFMDRRSKTFSVFHNDCEAVIEFLDQHPEHILTGFNVKHYDRYILSAICRSGDPAEVKRLNDHIINGGEGWDYPDRNLTGMRFSLCDLRDDCRQGLSLKEFEAHMGMNIRESDVPFDIARRLTEPELSEVVGYCIADVKAADRLFDLRIPYLSNKLALARESGIPAKDALYMTNAKLTAAYLGASAQPHDDEREYRYPANLIREYIPDEVFAFFDRIHDMSVPSETLFGESLDISLSGCPVTLGWGGIHGAIPCYEETRSDGRSIRNVDVASYYPHQMVINGYCSRNMKNPDIYADTIRRRVTAKKTGDKITANALKLVLNTTYGAMLNRYNDLYDPLMGRSVCISGQLQLLELASHLAAECPTLKLIQLNTDGIMISLDDTDTGKYKEIIGEWQSRTGFELEEDMIEKIVQKDVNNYVEVSAEGGLKIKGGILTRGISQAGAFNINNNAAAVAKAVTECLAFGTPPEETIAADGDIADFQLIAKAGSKYEYAYQMIGGSPVKVQNVNRVYAAGTDDNFRSEYGALYKKHKVTGSAARIAGLPAHCLTGNAGEVPIDVIDKNWYIAEARRYIRAFRGETGARSDPQRIRRIKKEILKTLEADNQLKLI